MSRYKENAKQEFDCGLFCAESVLITIAEELEITSPLIPGIASGFCSGMARTGGTCGALSGGMMGINIAFGRSTAAEPVDENYRAVQTLIQEFQKAFGSTNCTELLGYNLGTEEGRQAFMEKELYCQCREFTGTAAELAMQIIKNKGQAAGSPEKVE